MTKNSPNFKPAIGVILPIIILVIFSYFFQNSFLNNKEILTPWLQSFGPLLILVYVILQSLAIIIAPIGGLIFLLAIVGIFGPELGFTLSYLVMTPCYCINFLLAKKYGRGFVQKMLGEKMLNKFDHYANDAGIGTIIMLRIFLSGTFDYLSYILGITKLSFKTFVLINFTAGLPATFLAYYIFTRFDNFTESVIAFQIFGIVSTFIAILISHLQEKKRTKEI